MSVGCKERKGEGVAAGGGDGGGAGADAVAGGDGDGERVGGACRVATVVSSRNHE